jgi:hypothetical protein
MLLLEAVNLISTIIRHLTSVEPHRRMVAHSMAVRIYTSLLDAVFQFRACSQPAAPGTEEFIDGHQERDAILVQVVNQSLLVIRNLCTEKAALRVMQNECTASVVCNLLHSWRGCMDIALNVSRVLAKLSLIETFRTEINSRPMNLM